MSVKQFAGHLAVAIVMIALVCSPVTGQTQETKPQVRVPPLPQGTTLLLPGEYKISRLDVLSITVEEEPEASGKYTVDADGTVMFPRVGRLRAAGLSVREFEVELLRQLLAGGYFLDPHVTVTLEELRGRRVFVFGGVANPGMYPLPDGATLLEVLAKVGAGEASEVFVMRSPDAIGPMIPKDAKPADVFMVNLREVEKDARQGMLWRNMFLEDGDTVYVPRIDKNRVFVSGEVKNAGAYSVPDGTTVLELISLAGGVTESASIGRAKIIRIVAGKKKSIKVSLTDVVLPGDTVVVPMKWF